MELKIEDKNFSLIEFCEEISDGRVRREHLFFLYAIVNAINSGMAEDEASDGRVLYNTHMKIAIAMENFDHKKL